VIIRSTKSTEVAPATVAAETRTITQVVSGSGSTVAAESVSVNSEVSGTVEKLYVSLGDTVMKGAKLYRVSSDDAESALLKAKSSLLQADQSRLQSKQSLAQANSQRYSAYTQQVQAQQTLDRLESEPTTTTAAKDAIEIAERQLTAAKKSHAVAKNAITTAEAGVKLANANYTEAKSSYAEAAADVDKTVVTAPAAGTITTLPLSKGDYVTASSSSSSGSSSSGAASVSAASSSSSASSGSSIVIADLTDLVVTVSVSEVDVADLSVGLEATVTIDALSGQTFKGAVRSISPNGASTSGVVTYEVEVALDEGDERLRPDMTATTDIVTNMAENVVALPNSAIKSDGTTKYVLVLGADGTTQDRREVKIGASDDTYTEIVSGVTAGESVLTASATSTAASDSGGFRGPGIMGGAPGGDRGGN